MDPAHAEAGTGPAGPTRRREYGISPTHSTTLLTWSIGMTGRAAVGEARLVG